MTHTAPAAGNDPDRRRRIEEWAERQAAELPPLTDEQRARLRALLTANDALRASRRRRTGRTAA